MFRLAHISDPHLPPPPRALGGRDLLTKRLLSAIAWRRKGVDHQPKVLAALIADVRARRADHVALTGDLTNFSAEAEVAAARAWLATLGAPADITVSPGNHDALTGATDHQRFAPWREWLGDGPDVAFPAVRRRGPLALVNLCSATPTAPWLATGRLGEGQRARLEPLLAELAGQDAFRVLMLHHPPTRGAVSGRKSLEDGEALRALLRTYGADLILHGHAHEATIGALPGPGGPIPVLGVPSASAAASGRHAAARWHAFDFEPGSRRIRVSARGLSSQGDAFEASGSYLLELPQR